MSDTDSFIEEVTEEVRRERMFGYMRRYGWIAVVFVVLLVGGAAVNEVLKGKANAAAQATGDALFKAVEANDDAARIAALETLETPSPEAQIIAEFLLASHQITDGQTGAGADTLAAIALAEDEQPEIYKQVALYKSVLARGTDMPVEERRSLLSAMAAPGAPLSLLAQEQLALLDIEEGNAEAAIKKLETLIQDAGATAGLRRRSSQLIVALGGELPELSAQALGQ